jgi:hypothetical protein
MQGKLSKSASPHICFSVWHAKDLASLALGRTPYDGVSKLVKRIHKRCDVGEWRQLAAVVEVVRAKLDNWRPRAPKNPHALCFKVTRLSAPYLEFLALPPNAPFRAVERRARISHTLIYSMHKRIPHEVVAHIGQLGDAVPRTASFNTCVSNAVCARRDGGELK